MRARDAVVEEQARVEVVRQVHLKLQAALVDDAHRAAVVDALVLRCAALPSAMLDEDQLARRFERLGRGADHVVEPVGMLGRRAVVGPVELGDVQRVFVAIDHQRHFGDVALVDAVAGDAALRRPAAQVAGELAQAVGEFVGLPRRFVAQAAEGWALGTEWRGCRGRIGTSRWRGRRSERLRVAGSVSLRGGSRNRRRRRLPSPPLAAASGTGES